jgi:hypothetical protein
MRPFKPFWRWTKNTSSSAAHGFSAPLFSLKIFPSYLPLPTYLLPTSPLLPPSFHFLFTPSPECSLELEEGEKFNIERTWRIEGKRSASFQMQNQRRKVSSLPSLHFFFFFMIFFLWVFFFFFVWEEDDVIIFFFQFLFLFELKKVTTQACRYLFFFF